MQYTFRLHCSICRGPITNRYLTLTQQWSIRYGVYSRKSNHSNVTQIMILWNNGLCFWIVFPVLRRVRQLEKKLMTTDGRLPPVREDLSSFLTKLSDAQEFLHSAASTIQETDNRNRANILKFQRNEVISHDPPTVLLKSLPACCEGVCSSSECCLL